MERFIDERLRKPKCIKLQAEYFGFRERRSTLKYLQQLIYDLKTLLLLRIPVWPLFIDNVKAFDSINHDLLIYCLLKNDFHRRIMPVIYHFLKIRSARIEVNQSWGIFFSPSIGLSQGAVLFNFYSCFSYPIF